MANTDKLWGNAGHGALNAAADDFNSSIKVDSRMYREDILGSIAHANMLSSCGIIEAEEGAALTSGLREILNELESGELKIDMTAEDIHSFVELELTKRLGDTGKKLHTARSRNDQVALDVRLYLRRQCEETAELVKALIRAIAEQAEKSADAVMPGYTHLQRAQPITFAHQLLAYGMMFARDLGRISDAKARMNFSPLGCCALAGTTLPIDREMTAEALGFDGICLNSIDGVSDRDFCLELASALSILMMHLSRMSEELVIYSSWEFKFINLPDAFTTGSSIMPQKKNPDMAELIRGKCGRVYGDLTTLLTMLKGLPLAYNKDMQEDKEAIFDAFDTAKMCLGIAAPMIEGMTINRDKMLAAARGGFINATDLADYLVKKGVPFRTAYKLIGELVAKCTDEGRTLEDISLEEYKALSSAFEADLYKEISLSECVVKRTSAGGVAPVNIAPQLEYLKEITA